MEGTLEPGHLHLVLSVGSRCSGQQQPNYVPAQVPVNFNTTAETEINSDKNHMHVLGDYEWVWLND